MPIIKTFDLQDFINEFHAYNRGDQFSLDALSALFDYYDEVEVFEIDVIGICCDWSELSIDEVLESYNLDIDPDIDDDEDKLEAVVDALNDQTYAIALSNGNILLQNF